jgi:hypothetical protein
MLAREKESVRGRRIRPKGNLDGLKMKTDGLEFWDATYLALLAIGDVLTPRQQRKAQENFRRLACIRERSGETISSNFFNALAWERTPDGCDSKVH